ncbi:MAG: glycosyltransferase [Bacteroidales bacterium]|nr:glycosyltransferase [Bacteroidales bacterium]
MKILLINNHHSLKGGAHRVYFNTGKLLEDNGHDVAYFSTLDDESEPTKYQKYFVPRVDFKNESIVNKIRVSKLYLYNKRVYKAIAKLINDFKPDIAHIHLFYGGLSVSALRALKDNSIPIVHTVHDYRLICPVNTFLSKEGEICEKCKNKRYLNCLINKCSKGSLINSFILTMEAYLWKYIYKPRKLIDHFIFVSKFIRNKHIEFNEIYSSKSSQLYNFHNFDLTNGNIRGDYLFFYGRLSEEKGLRNLLEVISTLKVKIVIAGTGPLQSLVEEYSKKYSNIIYVGFKNGKELFTLIQNSFFVIVPSEWFENNPMTIVEAFSYGKPVIGANIGGIPELVIENETGFGFESGNKEELMRKISYVDSLSDEEYIRLSKNAKAFSEREFLPEKSYTELMKIYNLLLKDEKHCK